MEKTNLSIIRGDSLTLNVKIYDSAGQEIIVGEEGQVYFTMKKNYNTPDVLVQKKINQGIEYNEEKGYVITLNTNDTNKLAYGKYVFDVEYRLNDFVKTVAMGTIKLENEVTFVENEV